MLLRPADGPPDPAVGFLAVRSWPTRNGGQPFTGGTHGVQRPEAGERDHRSRREVCVWRDEMSEVLLAVFAEALGAALLALLMAAGRRFAARMAA